MVVGGGLGVGNNNILLLRLRWKELCLQLSHQIRLLARSSLLLLSKYHFICWYHWPPSPSQRRHTECILVTWSLHCWWFWQETTDTETVTTNMATHKYTPSSDTRAMLWSITGRQCRDHWWRPRGHEGRGAGHLVMMSSQHHNVWLSLRTGGDRAWSVRGPAETRSLSLYVVIWAHQPQPGRARPPWPGLASPGLLCLAPALETLAHCLQLSQL